MIRRKPSTHLKYLNGRIEYFKGQFGREDDKMNEPYRTSCGVFLRRLVIEREAL